uniref:Fucolectin tachylectin-4 pentraxin-1 domain-containing protein n=1 Tax=Sinocyclocheilus anshuiensis TaxID=1608454 RepID=A0A671RYZ9_9TELE
DWYAQNALDGLNSTCTHTDLQSDPWWKLNLRKKYSVNRVTITNRPDCYEYRINGAEIRIGNNSSDLFSNPVCAVVYSIPAGATYSYSCLGVYVIFPGNLATGRTVTQLSTYVLWFAQQAIDFNPGFIQPSSSCSSTNIQTNPWWRVDLCYIYRVSRVVYCRVVITNRLDCCPERINGAEIRIGNSLENNGNNNPICAVISSIPAGVSSTYTCNGMEGRYYLTLCEVEIYGEGGIKQTLVKMKLKSSLSLSEPPLQSALVERGFSDMTLQWSQPHKKDVTRKEAVPSECVHTNTGKQRRNVDFGLKLYK